jgi:hypothetical protein
MAWQLDPFLLSFLDSVEQELAAALETRHRQFDGTRGDESLAMRDSSERIALLRSVVDALQAALDRHESSVFH